VLLLLLLLLVLFGAGGDWASRSEKTQRRGVQLVMDDGLVVTAYDIDADFLGTEISWEGKRARMGHTTL
jgi:hypothetical protein